jgi:hypothetical protein
LYKRAKNTVSYLRDEMITGFKNMTTRFDNIDKELASLKGVPTAVARLAGSIGTLGSGVVLLLIKEWIDKQ